MNMHIVLCDLGGVAVEVESDRLISQVARLSNKSLETVREAVYREDLLVRLELGDIKPRSYYEGLKSAVKLAWSYEEFTRAWNGMLKEHFDVTEILGRLHKRHKIIALSNTNVLHLEYMKSMSPTMKVFDDWVASCEIGLRKPDPQIYLLALRRAGAKPEEAIFVDDRPEMVEGARSVGISGIQFETSLQFEQDLRQIGFNI